jgi:hypothetical protein
LKRLLLNLKSIRNRSRGQAPGNSIPAEILSTEGDFRLTRRDMITAMALIGSIPLLSSFGTTWLGSIRLERSKGSAIFHFRGKERWVIDVRRFAGRPKLDITHSRKEIVIRLRDALYPGTLVPAGFTCRLKPTLSGWRMTMTTDTGIDTNVSFEQWLLGLKRLSGSLSRSIDVTHPANTFQVRIPAGSIHSLSAGWIHSFGNGLKLPIILAGFGFVSNGITIRPPPDGSRSLFLHPPSRRSNISFSGIEAFLGITTSPSRDRQGFSIPETGFRQMTVELGMSTRKSQRTAFLAKADLKDNPVLVRPSPDLRDATGDLLAFSAGKLTYAAEFNGTESHEVLLATASEQIHWSYCGDEGMMLGCSGYGEDMEFEIRDKQLVRTSCKAMLLGTMLPPAGSRVITQPVFLREPVPITVSLDHTVNPKHSATRGNEIRMAARRENPPVLRLDNPSVELIRPDDLVVQRFEFVNMAFRGEGPDRVLTTTSGTPYMIVWHQPQNIGEEAFYEHAPNLDLSDANPKDPDLSNNVDKTLPYPPPVKARYSGPSRVVYKVPPGSTIPYRLEDLLEACRTFEMSVAPSALPPPVQAAGFHFIGAIAPSVAVPVIDQMRDVRRTPRQPNETNWDFVSRLAESPALRGAVSVTEGIKTVPPPGEQRMEAAQLIRAQRDITVSRNSMITADAVQPLSEIAQITTLLAPKPAPPGPYDTAIEAPYRLIVSPNRLNGWAHRMDPGQSDKTGRIELWHSRLGMRRQDGTVDEKQRWGRTIRAIWYTDPKTDDFKSNSQSQLVHEHDPFRMSLDWFDRHNLVHLTSNFQLSNPNGGNYVPRPVDVNRFMLSSLGAWMNVRGAWDVLPSNLSVEEWLHRGTLGRDHYVKVVYAGHLFPFGHRASLVKVTERKFEPMPGRPSVKVAYLRQRMFIIVREPVIVQALGNAPDDRKMPFKSIRVTTRATPILDDPGGSDYDGKKQSLFWPQVSTKDFHFNLVMEDVEGGLHEVSMPLAFVGKEILDAEADQIQTPLSELIADYNEGSAETRRKRPFGGQMVAFAPATTPGDTAFETAAVEFHAVKKTAHPFFVPVLNSASIDAPAVSQLTGSELTSVKISDYYLSNGFTSGGANAGEIFLDLVSARDFNVEGDGDKSGALVQPNMSITAFSRKSGTVGGDPDTFAGGNFDPEKYFGGGDDVPIDLKSAFSPKLFGVIDLWNILEAAGVDLPGKSPRFVTEALNVIEKLINETGRLSQLAQTIPAGSLAALNDLQNTTNQLLASFQSAISDPASFSAATLQNQLQSAASILDSVESQLATATALNESLRREAGFAVGALKQLLDVPAKISNILEEFQNFIQAIEMAREMRVRLEWKPDIKHWPQTNPVFIPSIQGVGDGSFVLAVELNANQGSSNGSGGQSFEVLCCLDNFTINLIGNKTFVKVFFNKMAFSARTGKKPAIDIDFRGLEFGGPLAFVERLRALIPLDGFSDPPYVKVDTGGIEAGFTFEIPSVGLGIITLQNIVLGAKTNIPFIGEPLSIGFHFNTRETPCTITVYGIGGGAFVGVAVNMNGLQIVEAALEFGGSVAFNVAVASGSVHIMAGIYFKMELTGGVTEVMLTGYLRIGGKVSVLALISISIELRMELTYITTGDFGKVRGKASLEIKVKIVFFSIGVTLTVERQFAATNNDPTFLDAMGHPYVDPFLLEEVDPWEQYCIAYSE